MAKVTLKEVAKIAGVSPRTVSRVMNKDKNVKEETRIKIEKIIKETGYQTNFLAKSLREQRTRTIIVFVETQEDMFVLQFYSVVIKSIIASAHELDYNLVVSQSTQFDFDNNKNDGFNLLKHGYADGAIIFDSYENDERINYLTSANIPFVIIGKDTRYENASYLYFDNYKAGYMAGKYLIENNYVPSCFVNSDINNSNIANTKSQDINNHDIAIKDRIDGFIEAFREKNLLDSCIIASQNYTYEDFYNASKRVLEQTKVRSFFVSGDEKAIGVYKAIRESGLSIPGDVAVLGIDNIPIGNYYYPELSTISQPLHHYGSEAVRILDRIIKGDKFSQKVVFQPELIIRKST